MSEIAMANWIRDICLEFGATVSTAYKVAGLFVEGLEREGYWLERGRKDE